MPEAAYVLLRMMQPFWCLKSVPEVGNTIGHHIPTREVKVNGKEEIYKYHLYYYV